MTRPATPTWRHLASAVLAAAALTVGCAPATDSPAAGPPGAAPEATPAAPRTATTPVPDDRLVVALPADVAGFDPRAQRAFRDITLHGVILEPLLSLSHDFALVPRLAIGWDVTDEGHTVTFRLREGVTFHDGRAFTAEDVRFTFEAILASADATARSALTPVTSIETPDAHTVVLRIDDPTRGVLIGLASVPILPAGSWDEVDARPIGTGPFSFARRDVGTALFVERFEAYWGDASDVPAVEFRVIADAGDRTRALIRGTAHLSQSQWSAEQERSLDGDRNVRFVRTHDVSYQYLGINPARPPFEDLDVRHALNHLVPRERIVADVLGGRAFPAASLLVPSMPWFDPATPAYAYDVDRARALIDGSASTPFERTYTIITNVNPIREGIAEVLTASFAQVGMRVEVEVLDFSTYLDRVYGRDFDMYLLGLAGAYNVGNLLAGHVSETGLYNRYGFSDPEAEAMLREAVSGDPSSPDAVALFREVANRLVAYSAQAFLYHGVVTGASRADVEGWNPHPVPDLAYQDLHLVHLGP